ncbi:MAG: hypothetical protein ACYC0F_13450 [Rhodanobacter sp.]
MSRHHPMKRHAATAHRPGTLALCLLATLATFGAQAADVDRKIPDGTLTYRIVLSGHAEARGPDEFHGQVKIERQFEATVRMHGSVTTDPDAAAGGSQMMSLQKAVEACNDDQACMMRAVNAMSSGQREALNREAQHTVAALGSDTGWSHIAGTPCRGSASVNDSSSHTGRAVGEGISEMVSNHATRIGKHGIDCSDDDYTLITHGGGKTYDVQFPSVEVEVTIDEFNPGIPPYQRRVRIPELKLKGLVAARLDGPQGGHKIFPVLQTVAGPVSYRGMPGVPLKAEVSWTFNPDGQRR